MLYVSKREKVIASHLQDDEVFTDDDTYNESEKMAAHRCASSAARDSFSQSSTFYS